MNNPDKVLTIFCDEVIEHIEVINNNLLEIEKAKVIEKVNQDNFKEFMRAAHTLKGAARMAELHNMAKVAHALESIVLAISNGSLPLQTTVIDMLFEAIDEIKNIIDLLKNSGDKSVDNNLDIILKKLELFVEEEKKEKAPDTQIKNTARKEETKTIVENTEKKEAPKKVPEKINKEEEKKEIDAKGREKFPAWNPNDYELVLEDFLSEAEECLERINTNLIKLEEEKSIEILNEIFRAAHTLKGNSGTVNLLSVQNLTHAIENIFDDLRNEKYEVTQDIIDVLLKCMDVLGEIFTKIRQREIIDIDVHSLIDLLNAIKNNLLEEAQAAQMRENKDDIKSKLSALSATMEDSKDKILKNSQKIIQKQTIRVDSQKLDNIMNLVGELVINKISLDEQLQKLNMLLLDIEKNRKLMNQMKIDALIDKKSSYKSLLKDIKKIVTDTFLIEDEANRCEAIINAIDLLFEKQLENRQVADDWMTELNDEIKSISSDLNKISSISYEIMQGLIDSTDQVGFITKELQNEVMKTRMVPVSNIFNKFPRTVRDLSHAMKKNIKLEIFGEETELDKNVIDKMGDPLMHLIRNCIDHGIELPEVRIKKGKPEQGTIKLSAYYRGNQVIIEVEDDGAGLDSQKILKKAIEKGLVTEEESVQLTKKQIYNFIFSPGFSTAEKITDISGRGVGMDVVRDNITQLKGIVDVESKEGEYTKFIIKLPLTVAIIQVLLVKVTTEIFAIPVFNIEETLKILPDQIKKVGDKDVINIRGEVVSVVNLRDVLELNLIETEPKEDNFISICVVGLADKRIGFVVEELLGNQEVVIKNLGSYFQKIKHISGATILGSGKIILILDIPALINTSCEGEYSISSFKFVQQIEETIAEKPKEEIKEQKKEEQKEILKEDKIQTQKKILIVEDSKSIRTIIRSFLEEANYIVEEAVDGYDGLQKAKEKQYDIICTDITMPRMDGYTLTKNLRKIENYKLKPIIIISSHDREVDKLKGFEAGADDYILKPLDKEYFLDHIKKFLNK
ncbi:MAG TPA: hybrid sensor histidine kinase/response regulator [bacterium]|nr:hybrid sensor histidine kinase/response regulator [bacterium]HOL47454.1 hybrid sensor histidine kinase/response regulator [bacterium]HPQ18934.1 hybrid sensor histidine kinase/response regulator [bacterium]